MSCTDFLFQIPYDLILLRKFHRTSLLVLSSSQRPCESLWSITPWDK